GAVFVHRSKGGTYLAKAKTVVVAGNGVGTPRLLLASASNSHPDGLANSSGLVGKRLMLHPTASVVGLFDRPMSSERGVWGQIAYSLNFYETDKNRDFVRGAKWSLQPTGSPAQNAKRWPWGEANPLFGDNFHSE